MVFPRLLKKTISREVNVLYILRTHQKEGQKLVQIQIVGVLF
jgi:hypothetical protein